MAPFLVRFGIPAITPRRAHLEYDPKARRNRIGGDGGFASDALARRSHDAAIEDVGLTVVSSTREARDVSEAYAESVASSANDERIDAVLSMLGTDRTDTGAHEQRD
jgi:hypothetical protein